MKAYCNRLAACCMFFLGTLFISCLQAQEWGNLTGRFLYAGEPPVRQPIEITKDKEYCGKCNLLEEDLVVDAKTKGVANVIVWLYVAKRKPPPPVHPAYAKTDQATVIIDSEECRVKPHVSLLRTSQTLLIRNTDSIGDGLKIDAFRNSSVNLLLGPNAEMTRRFPKPERLPAPVSCPIHPWESGWLLVLQHPYMAVSDTEGRFEIKNIPAGKWTFQFWQERAGYLDQVKMAGKSQSWRRGRLEIDISAETTDLGPIELAPEIF